jgi:hypothetical protein
VSCAANPRYCAPEPDHFHGRRGRRVGHLHGNVHWLTGREIIARAVSGNRSIGGYLRADRVIDVMSFIFSPYPVKVASQGLSSACAECIPVELRLDNCCRLGRKLLQEKGQKTVVFTPRECREARTSAREIAPLRAQHRRERLRRPDAPPNPRTEQESSLLPLLFRKRDETRRS